MLNRNPVTLEQKLNNDIQPIDAVSRPTSAKPMLADGESIKCTRCRHKHQLSDRVDVKNNKTGWFDKVCPKCNSKVYTAFRQRTRLGDGGV